MSRRYFHLHSGCFSSAVLLGPDLRALEMARTAASLGMESNLVVADPGSDEHAGIRLRSLADFRLDEIASGDAVVLSESIAARIPFLLARRGIPFHVDLYGLPPAELIPVYLRWSSNARRIDRARRTLRLQFAVHHAERIYLSHPGQLPMLAGIAFAGNQASAPEAIDSLTSRVAYLPMGVPSLGFVAENPYPDFLQGRPVFLFGGGIWSWFDIDTLIRAFSRASDRGSDAALFFLAGEDHSGIDTHRQAVVRAKILADELGATDRCVVFNARAAGSKDLSSYLGHCRAGAMANPAGLEAQTSWRTRYLDLLAAERPLVVAGSDPLADRMALAGSALRTPEADVEALADSICRLAVDEDLARRMGEASRILARELSWNAILGRYGRILSSTGSFRATRKPSWSWVLRYAIAPMLARWD